jgi:hypothetical protein
LFFAVDYAVDVFEDETIILHIVSVDTYFEAIHIAISIMHQEFFVSELPRPEGRGFPLHRQYLHHCYVM